MRAPPVRGHGSGGSSHRLGVPSPPQMRPPEHVPQLRVPPQPSGAVPQFQECAAHVVGVQRQAPPEQLSFVRHALPQEPQFARSESSLVVWISPRSEARVALTFTAGTVTNRLPACAAASSYVPGGR